jgi:two-component sensor histidine kinase
MWIIIMTLYVYFVLGKIWGAFTMFLNIAGLTVIFVGESQGLWKLIPKELTLFSKYNFIINASVACLIFCYLINQMIKQTKLAEEKLTKSNDELSVLNEEKTLMLKEIHHRVKNNLQVITSLLRLQSHEMKDDGARRHFHDSINRVSAMAMIHEKMYQSELLNQISLKQYLETLVDDLIISYSGNTEIERQIQSDIKTINPKHLVPLALIFNELVSNSIEHAFKNKTKGQIRIDARYTNKKGLIIHYSDDGEWLMPKDESSFGLELIETFTHQLDGTFERITENGTTYRFLFNSNF